MDRYFIDLSNFIKCKPDKNKYETTKWKKTNNDFGDSTYSKTLIIKYENLNSKIKMKA